MLSVEYVTQCGTREVFPESMQQEGKRGNQAWEAWRAEWVRSLSHLSACRAHMTKLVFNIALVLVLVNTNGVCGVFVRDLESLVEGQEPYDSRRAGWENF